LRTTTLLRRSRVRSTHLNPQSLKLGQPVNTGSSIQRTMTTVNKTEDEWRVILSPQQVRLLIRSPDDFSLSNLGNSFEFWERREPKDRELESTTNLIRLGYTVVQVVVRHCIKAVQSSMYDSFFLVDINQFMILPERLWLASIFRWCVDWEFFFYC